MCNCNNKPLCSNNDCSCPVKDLSTDCVLYTGDDLACSGIKSQTILTDLIQQLDEFICNLDIEPTPFNLVNVGTGSGLYKGIISGNGQLRSIKSPDNSITVAISPSGNEVNLTLGSEDLLNKISLSFDWKNDDVLSIRTPETLPKQVTDNEYLRNGFIGYHKPIIVNGEVDHPLIQRDDLFFYEPILIEASIQNLGVKIKNFNSIKDFSPTLVISKYTNSEKRKDKNPLPAPDSTTGELFPDLVYRKGSFKFSSGLDLIDNPRLTRVPLQAQYQVVDFGQEHYFKTSLNFQKTGYLSTSNQWEDCEPLIRTRACGTRYSTVGRLHGLMQFPGTENKLQKFTSFVYLQFHIEITVNGQKFLSKALGKLKMILEVPFDIEVNPTNFPEDPPFLTGSTVDYDYLISEPHKPKITIRYKHT